MYVCMYVRIPLACHVSAKSALQLPFIGLENAYKLPILQTVVLQVAHFHANTLRISLGKQQALWRKVK